MTRPRPRSTLVDLLLGTLTLCLLASPTAAAQRAEDFGFPAIPMIGERPLLTILIDFGDSHFPEGALAPAYYQRLLFATELGQPIGSVAGRGGFFDENSLGQFRFTNQGVFGPYRAVDNPFTAQDESTLACGGVAGVVWPVSSPGISVFPLCSGIGWTARNAILAAAADGFDFAALDANHDGQVSTATELAFLQVIATPGFGNGHNRALNGLRGCVRVREEPPLDVCGAVATVDADTTVATIAHELAHQFGISWEAYGRWPANENARYTVMGATAGATNGGLPLRDLHMWHFDPFVKIKLGWINPQIIDGNSSGCLVLRAIEDANLALPSPAIVLHDPRRGLNEFFILEYRRSRPSNYDGDPWHTGSIGMAQDRGLAVWAMRTDLATNPLVVPSQDGARNCGADLQQRCMDSAVHIYPPANLFRVGSPPPNRGLWTPADGAASLFWVQSDSALTPITLRVAAALDKGDAIAVELNGGSCSTEVFKDRIQESFWDPPIGIRSYDRRFLDDVPVPLVVHSWIHPDFLLQRTVPQFVPPGDPLPVQWAITSTGTDSTPMRLRILDETPPGFDFNGDATEIIFDEVRPNDGLTRARSYELAPSIDSRRAGDFPVVSDVSFESPADGSPFRDPVALESFVVVSDPNLPVLGNLPPHSELALAGVKVDIDGHAFDLKATFSLAAASDGIDPLTEQVRFSIGTFAAAIPAAAFRRKPSKFPAEYSFNGDIEGVSLRIKLTQRAVNRFEFKAEGKGAVVAALLSAEIVSLAVGDDGGTTVASKVEQ